MSLLEDEDKRSLNGSGTRVSFADDSEDEDDVFGDFDFAKLLVIANKSLVWVILLVVLSVTGAFLYVRYTKPVFESSSILKLDLKSEAGVLGLNKFNDDNMPGNKLSTISGEIEFLKSRFLYEKVVDRMKMNVSYYAYGNILYEERYNNAPFKVIGEIKNQGFLNFKFDITFLDKDKFQLSYKMNDEEVKSEHYFGEKISTENYTFTLYPTTFWSANEPGAKYFFTMNSKEALVNNLMENVSVSILNLEANTILLSYKNHNYIKATDIVNTIDSVYLEQTLENKSKSHEQTIKFLEASLLKTEENLAKAEKELETFVRNNRTVDVKQDFGKTGVKIEELEKEKQVLKSRISMLSELKDLILDDKDVNNFIPALSQIENSQLSAAINSLNTLQEERNRLLNSQRENTLVVKSKNKSIERIKENILELVDINKRMLFQQTGEINAKMVQLEQEVLSLPSKETEFTRLKRFYSIYEKFYLLLMEKEAEFGIAKAGTIPNFVILSPALNNPNPIYPKKIFIYISGLGIGIFLGISLIAIRYLLNDTISTQKELERSLHASMLGGIPEYSKEKMEVSKLVVDKNPKSAISEALRSVRTNLEFICPNKKKKLIAVTSTVSGEGKTFVASNLSGVIALSNQKVILLDLDMRKPKVHLAFEKENFKGMSTVLIGKHTLEECIQPTSISNLSFISAGPTPPNPSELILREEFDLLIKRLFEIYDVVVIDTPPVGLVTDGILILRKADIPLYVVRTDYSKKSAKRNINKLVKTIPKLCVLMNALKAINTYGYGGYGYGYGYGYYEGETEKETIISKLKSLAGVKA